MKILKDIIENIKADAKVREIRKGVFWTAVTSRYCGLASTMIKDLCPHENEENNAFYPLSDKTALELSQFSLSEDISEASIGLAAINSLIDIDESRCVEINASELLMQRGKDKNISVIGHFPFTDDLRSKAKNLWVIEKSQRPGDYAEDDAEKYLPLSDIIAISSTTLINHTLPGLLSLCSEKSLKMLLGPTTPMSRVFFDYGIDIVSGSRVIDEDKALKYISEGANFRQLKQTGCISLISMVKNIPFSI